MSDLMKNRRSALESAALTVDPGSLGDSTNVLALADAFLRWLTGAIRAEDLMPEDRAATPIHEGDRVWLDGIEHLVANDAPTVSALMNDYQTLQQAYDELQATYNKTSDELADARSDVREAVRVHPSEAGTRAASRAAILVNGLRVDLQAAQDANNELMTKYRSLLETFEQQNNTIDSLKVELKGCQRDRGDLLKDRDHLAKLNEDKWRLIDEWQNKYNDLHKLWSLKDIGEQVSIEQQNKINAAAEAVSNFAAGGFVMPSSLTEPKRVDNRPRATDAEGMSDG